MQNGEYGLYKFDYRSEAVAETFSVFTCWDQYLQDQRVPLPHHWALSRSTERKLLMKHQIRSATPSKHRHVNASEVVTDLPRTIFCMFSGACILKEKLAPSAGWMSRTHSSCSLRNCSLLKTHLLMGNKPLSLSLSLSPIRCLTFILGIHPSFIPSSISSLKRPPHQGSCLLCPQNKQQHPLCINTHDGSHTNNMHNRCQSWPCLTCAISYSSL